MPQEKKICSEIGRTSICEAVKMKLWAVSGGRCEICNRILYSDLAFGMPGNYAEMAHIHAVSAGGPRHKYGMSSSDKNDISNLMLLCEEHHHMIDTCPDEFSDGFLIAQKERHEAKIRAVTEIGDTQSCRMVSYFTNVDNCAILHSDRLFKQAVISASLFPKQLPVINLSAESCVRFQPTAADFSEKAHELELQVRSWFGEIVKPEDAIAIFALAPQPLLIKLGTLVNDQLNALVFQCHRTGSKWAWPDDNTCAEYIVKKTHSGSDTTVALVLDLSAEITDCRIINILGMQCGIYHLTIPEPNRDFVKNKNIQDSFVSKFRSVLEMIKNDNPGATCIHLFPAMPNSLAIRAGMDYMPKADLPLIVYEQVESEIGFIEALEIGG